MAKAFKLEPGTFVIVTDAYGQSWVVFWDHEEREVFIDLESGAGFFVAS